MKGNPVGAKDVDGKQAVDILVNPYSYKDEINKSGNKVTTKNFIEYKPDSPIKNIKHNLKVINAAIDDSLDKLPNKYMKESMSKKGLEQAAYAVTALYLKYKQAELRYTSPLMLKEVSMPNQMLIENKKDSYKKINNRDKTYFNYINKMFFCE